MQILGSENSQTKKDWVKYIMLSNKIAVITGSGSGIGKATAKIFVRENIAGIAIVDYNYEAACKTAEELGPVAFPVKCDVSKAEQLRKLLI